MNYRTVLMASCAAMLIGATAQADCADELAKLSGEDAAQGATANASADGISKDGSLAPLESPEGASSQAGADDGIAKDGSLAPLEQSESGTDAIAMSGQDVAAQQDGEPVAAEEAAMARDKADATAESATAASRDDLLTQAREALAAGDEAACLAAVEDLKAL